jgi:hypothetical protein
MSGLGSRRAVELLLDEANRYQGETRFSEMLRAAESAVARRARWQRWTSRFGQCR